VGHDKVAGAWCNWVRTDRYCTPWFIDEFHLEGEDGDWTPLMGASRTGPGEMAKLLMKAGASPGMKLSDGTFAGRCDGPGDIAAILTAVRATGDGVVTFPSSSELSLNTAPASSEKPLTVVPTCGISTSVTFFRE
jgi:hypothetical protein